MVGMFSVMNVSLLKGNIYSGWNVRVLIGWNIFGLVVGLGWYLKRYLYCENKIFMKVVWVL